MCGENAPRESARRGLLEQVAFAVDAGVDVVQVREQDLSASDLLGLVRDAVALTIGSKTHVVVNDRLDVALAAGAHGVHLKSSSMAPADVKRIVPQGFLVGRSVHSLEEVGAAAGAIDYAIAGTVWPSRSKPDGHACLGVDGLAAIAASAGAPTLAIGGVSVTRMAEIARAGCAGAAAIQLFMAAAAAGTGACRVQPLVSVVSEARRMFDTARVPS
ncbi:MAG: thiamine phosphate synthase [Vicinamibacterales bacterium]